MTLETQLSVFLVNKPGVLGQVCDVLAKARVNLTAGEAKGFAARLLAPGRGRRFNGPTWQRCERTKPTRAGLW